MIRRLERKDRDTFLRLSEMFYSSEAVMHSIPSRSHADTFEELMRSEEYADAFLLESDGIPVGFALTAKTWSREAGGKVLWLEELFILGEYRSKGLGREYFSFIEEYARSNGFMRIRLEVEPSNTRARSLYERLGYIPLEYEQMVKDLQKN